MEHRKLCLSQKITSKIGKAISDFGMIKPGDHITAGLSGGKDSILLLLALASVRDKSPVNFTLDACMIDITGGKTDCSLIRHFCEETGIELDIVPYPVLEIIESRNEDHACSFCSNMRGGILFSHAKAKGATKVAMGHNLDDVVETALLNLFHSGRFSCFSPRSWRSRTGLWLIRPMVYLAENIISGEVQRLGLPTLEPMCPFSRDSKRARIKDLVGLLAKEIPDIRSQVLHALKGIKSENT